jgi:molybdopterin-containing oxidoreductase family iron-sulfur binding subunit
MGFDTEVKVEKVAGHSTLACTQDDYPITAVGRKEEAGRIGKLIVEADLAEYKKHPDFARHAVHQPEPAPLWKEHVYGPYRWGMAIDLSTCIGCGACVLACQAENNIPVVGREQVLRRRAMHWLRVDRYFRGSPDQPTVAFQPVTCMHCENAPCEQVCPVAATVHDKEGLNVMVYNRCVGTRYCSNNCPFKVRRFNFFNYRLNLSETEKMVMNPEVTVRSRGVMEKCTYCVQRIMAAKVRAKNDRRPIRDGEVVPACAQACPTGSIIFGDLNDKDSAAARLHADGRAYALLPELNLRTRTVYLARIRNPRAEGEDQGLGSRG